MVMMSYQGVTGLILRPVVHSSQIHVMKKVPCCFTATHPSHNYFDSAHLVCFADRSQITRCFVVAVAVDLLQFGLNTLGRHQPDPANHPNFGCHLNLHLHLNP